jgi:hypothetical protein
LQNSNDVLLAFGRLESSGSFVGCLGDVLLGGRLMSLAQGTSNELTMSGCTMAGPTGDGMSPKEVEEGIQEAERARNGGGTAEEAVTGKTPKPPQPSSKVRPEGACALPLVPYGEREDSSGLRFGISPSARLEFSGLAMDGSDLAFSVQLRATAANGVIMFATDERHNQFAVLYLQDGKPAFASRGAKGQQVYLCCN